MSSIVAHKSTSVQITFCFLLILSFTQAFFNVFIVHS